MLKSQGRLHNDRLRKQRRALRRKTGEGMVPFYERRLNKANMPVVPFNNPVSQNPVKQKEKQERQKRLAAVYGYVLPPKERRFKGLDKQTNT